MTSTTKRLSTTRKTQKIRNDSFDRFGDDLSGLLLAQLPTLADRFRCECVCRQWQRLVYSGHRELIVDRELAEKFQRKYTMKKRFGLLLAKCSNISAVKLYGNGIDQIIIDRIMDLLVNNNIGNNSTGGHNNNNNTIQSYEVHSRVCWSRPVLRTLIGHIRKFRRLRHLAIDCPLNQSVNPCVDELPTVARDCPDLRSLSVRVYCLTAEHLMNIITGVQLFPRLDRLHLALYISPISGQKVFSVQRLANCPRLKHLSLECSPDMDFTDVRKVNKQLKRPAIVTKINPQLMFDNQFPMF